MSAGESSRDDRAQVLVLLAVWAAFTVSALHFVWRFKYDLPRADDFTFIDVATGARSVSFDWLVRPHNEHRVVVPRLVLLALYELTDYDFRVGCYFQVLLLSGLALVSMAFMRRLRGRASVSDAVFPLLWLHWGHADNWLMGFQVSVVLPVVLFVLVVLSMARHRGPPDAREAALSCAALVALALCGGSGLVLSVFLASWLALAGVEASKIQWKGASRIALLGALVVLLTVAVCFVGIQRQSDKPAPLGLVLVNVAAFLSASIGLAADWAWPLSSVTVLVVAAAFVGLVRVARVDRVERLRALGSALALLGIVAMATAVAVSRVWISERAGFAQRYIVLASPFVAVTYVAAHVTLIGRLRGTVRWSLFAIVLLATPINMWKGQEVGEWARKAERAVVDGIDAGQTSYELAIRNQRYLLSDDRALVSWLAAMRAAKLGPFRKHGPAVDPDPADARMQPYFMFSELPRSVTSTQQHRPFLAYGVPVYLAMPDSRIEFVFPEETRLFRARFGMVPQSFNLGSTDGVRFRVEARAEAGTVVLFERTLDPKNRPEDRGMQKLEIPFPGGARGHLFLVTDNEEGKNGSADGSFWTDVEFVKEPGS